MLTAHIDIADLHTSASSVQQRKYAIATIRSDYRGSPTAGPDNQATRMKRRTVNKALPYLDGSGWPTLRLVHAFTVLRKDKLLLGVDKSFLGSHLHVTSLKSAPSRIQRSDVLVVDSAAKESWRGDSPHAQAALVRSCIDLIDFTALRCSFYGFASAKSSAFPRQVLNAPEQHILEPASHGDCRQELGTRTPRHVGALASLMRMLARCNDDRTVC